MGRPFVQNIRFVLQILVLLLLLLPCSISAHSGDGSSQNTERETAGITESLGTKIPLDVTFRDETGKPVKLAKLITGPTIILPVFYRCTNVCSVLQFRTAAALQKLELSPVIDYRVISISFDEQETPDMAARSRKTYLSTIKKPFPEEGWRFLTGDRTAIHRLFDVTGFHFQRQGADFSHPVVSIMVAGDGKIIRYLYGVTVLPKDLALAITEARSGVAGTSIRKVMDFCFTYDPVGKTYVFNLLRVSAATVILVASGFMAFLVLTNKKRRPSSGDNQ
ncbi:MAG: SCO family protein [Geobacteraceae bacterium]|nr:SCO family protein [Geobacteraceae bacterium]